MSRKRLPQSAKNQMVLALTLSLLLTSLRVPSAVAQNLVPNPSMESFQNCPNAYSQFNTVDYWYTPTAGSSDYFNACSTNPDFDIPANFAGEEAPFEGSGYAGIIAWLGPNAWREYISAPLLEPLVAGAVYDVSFHVSLADHSGLAIDAFGAYLSASPISVSSFQPLNLPAQVMYSGGLLAQTNGWTKIEGSFTATGGERYITIGVFGEPANIVQVSPGANDLDVLAYYLIDSVAVTTLCSGDSIAFPSLGLPGTGFADVGAIHLEGDYQFEVSTSNVGSGGQVSSLFANRESDPVYSGRPGIFAAGTYQGINEPGIVMSRTDAQPFEVCTLTLAEGMDSGANEVLFGRKSDLSTVIQNVSLNGVLYDAEEVPLVGFNDLQMLRAIGYTNMQWTEICASSGPSCNPPSITQENSSYCVDGSSTGLGWSWKLTSTSERNVAGIAVGAPATDLVVAIVADLVLAGVTAYQNVSQPQCFDVVLTAGDSLHVGQFGVLADCEVSNNPNGCTFNPTITDATFLSPFPGESALFPITVPGINLPGQITLVMTLMAFALVGRLRFVAKSRHII